MSDHSHNEQHAAPEDDGAAAKASASGRRRAGRTRRMGWLVDFVQEEGDGASTDTPPDASAEEAPVEEAPVEEAAIPADGVHDVEESGADTPDAAASHATEAEAQTPPPVRPEEGPADVPSAVSQDDAKEVQTPETPEETLAEDLWAPDDEAADHAAKDHTPEDYTAPDSLLSDDSTAETTPADDPTDASLEQGVTMEHPELEEPVVPKPVADELATNGSDIEPSDAEAPSADPAAPDRTSSSRTSSDAKATETPAPQVSLGDPVAEALCVEGHVAPAVAERVRRQLEDPHAVLWRELIAQDHVPAADAYAVAAEVLEYKVAPLTPDHPDADFVNAILRLFPAGVQETLQELNVLPVEMTIDPEAGGHLLTVATHDPSCEEVEELVRSLGMTVTLTFAPEAEVRQRLYAVLGGDDDEPNALEALARSARDTPEPDEETNAVAPQADGVGPSDAAEPADASDDWAPLDPDHVPSAAERVEEAAAEHVAPQDEHPTETTAEEASTDALAPDDIPAADPVVDPAADELLSVDEPMGAEDAAEDAAADVFGFDEDDDLGWEPFAGFGDDDMEADPFAEAGSANDAPARTPQETDAAAPEDAVPEDAISADVVPAPAAADRLIDTDTASDDTASDNTADDGADDAANAVADDAAGDTADEDSEFGSAAAPAAPAAPADPVRADETPAPGPAQTPAAGPSEEPTAPRRTQLKPEQHSIDADELAEAVHTDRQAEEDVLVEDEIAPAEPFGANAEEGASFDGSSIDLPDDAPVADTNWGDDEQPDFAEETLDDPELQKIKKKDRVIAALFGKGAISTEQMRKAKIKRDEEGLKESFWRILAQVEGVNREAIFAEAAGVYAFPTADIRDGKPDPEFARSVTDTFDEEYRDQLLELGVLPYEVDLESNSGAIKVAFITHDPTRPDVHRMMQKLKLERFELRYAPERVVRGLIAEAFPRKNEYLERIDDDGGAMDLGTSYDDDNNLVDDEALEAEMSRSKLINLFEATLVEATRQGVSDIHIWPNADKQVEIHFRLDGRLQSWHVEKKVHPEALIAVIKDNSMNVDRFERDAAQDGFIQRWIDDTLIRFRVSVMPIANAASEVRSESIVIRVLDDRKVIKDLRKLGLQDLAFDRFKRAISQPHGMVILTGPTGSGKTTTLYAALHEVVSPEVNVLTVEDPVEYILPGVRQIKLNSKLGLEDALRSILRHDPDVVMVGEMRDRHTAELAIKLANTGHLTFSTLHTNDAASAVSRLYKMGVEPFLIAYAINLVVAQRLIRKLCTQCKRVDPNPDPIFLKNLGFTPEDIEQTTFHTEGNDRKCPKCGGLGYKGRRAVTEAMYFTREMRHLIADSEGKLSDEDIKDLAVKDGMLTLQDSAKLIVQSGETSAEEMMRVVASRD